jgi:hypothetical protein
MFNKYGIVIKKDKIVITIKREQIYKPNECVGIYPHMIRVKKVEQ